TDLHVVLVQIKPLFDMELEIGIKAMRFRLHLPTVPNAFQFRAQCLAVIIFASARPFQAISADKTTGTKHGRRKPTAFLVGPTDDFDGPLRLMPQVIQCTAYFQRAEHAGDTVKAPAVDLGIQVAAQHDGSKTVVRASATGKN